MISEALKRALMASWLVLSCASVDPDDPGGSSDVTYASWRGTIASPGSKTVDISYELRMQGTDWCLGRFQGTCSNFGRILLPFSAEEGSERQVEMTDAEWDGMTLKYSWTDVHGTELRCELVKQTKTLLSGDCLDPNGGTGAHMTMSPPPGRLDSN